MANFYGTYPIEGGGGGGVTTYANLAAFPAAATAGDGALAIALDTHILYESNGASWLPISGPGSYITLGSLDAAAATASGANISATGVLSMQSADSTHPGLVNNTAQTLGSGTKTVDNLIDSGLTASQAVVTNGSKQLVSLAYTAAPTGSTLVSRDVNGTSTFTNIVEATAAIVSSGQTITMSYGSAGIQRVSGVSTVIFTLPDATTMYSSQSFDFNNNSTSAITVNNKGGSLIISIPAGGYSRVINTDNSTTNGTWDVHNWLANASVSGTSGTTIVGTLTAAQIIDSGLTASTVPYADSSKQLTSSSVTPTELGYVSGVTSAIQTQLNAKGVGSVTSVAASVPSVLSISGSPVTGSGTLAIGYSGTALPIANGGTNKTSVTSAPGASLWAGWDANSNLSANNLIEGYATTATAAGTTTLVVGSAFQQYFTGTTTQTVVLPVTSTLVLGQSYSVTNASTGVVTVQSSGANTIIAQAAGTTVIYTVILTSGTTAASWASVYVGNGGAVTPTVSTVGTASHTGSFPANTSGNYTTPANVAYIRVREVGGGGGGGGSGTTGGSAATVGTASTFGSQLSAGGGGLGGTGGAGGGAGGSASLGSGPVGLAIPGTTGNAFPSVEAGGVYGVAGGAGGSAPMFSGAGAPVYQTGGGAGLVGTGGGGSGAGAAATANAIPGSGGGSGGYVDAIIVPTPGQVFAYVVGAGGNAGGAGGGAGSSAGAAGGSGYIEVTEFYNNGAIGTATNVTGIVAVANGGTGQTTKAPAFDALQPMTTGGDLIYGGASGTGTRLANGSSGNFLKSAGGTSAPTWSAFTAPTVQRFTSGTAQTYTTPTSPAPLYIKIKMVGGGGGGGGGGATNPADGTDGAASTFGASLTAGAGLKGLLTGGNKNGGAGGTNTISVGNAIINAAGGSGGGELTNAAGGGGIGGASALAGAGGSGGGATVTGSVGQNAGTNSGSGGGGAGGSNTYGSGSGGGAGGYLEVTITSSIAATYTYTVGAKGTGGTGGTGGAAGGDGGAGCIVVEEYYQ